MKCDERDTILPIADEESCLAGARAVRLGCGYYPGAEPEREFRIAALKSMKSLW